jgi:hypothetical protein
MDDFVVFTSKDNKVESSSTLNDIFVVDENSGYVAMFVSL